jgi:hypothetical protein
MLTPRLTNCTCCADIVSLINEIDCRMAQLAGNMYNNLTLMLNQNVPADAMMSLLTYRRILQCKYVNATYCNNYTISQIASKVKLLKYRK